MAFVLPFLPFITAAATIYSAYAATQNKLPAPPAPIPPPQASLAPGVQAVRQQVAGMGQAGGSPGVGQTLLTGPGGVDPSKLNLGRATTLGG